jgi:hypothetical protein
VKWLPNFLSGTVNLQCYGDFEEVKMSEVEQEVQPVIVTIDDQQYDMNQQSDASKEHYVEVLNLRKELGELQNQIAAAQRRSVNLQVALGFRENALKESIEIVEEPEEVVN